MFTAKLTNGEYIVTYGIGLNCIEMSWEGYSTSEEFCETNERILSILIAEQADKILADASELLIIDVRDQK